MSAKSVPLSVRMTVEATFMHQPDSALRVRQLTSRDAEVLDPFRCLALPPLETIEPNCIDGSLRVLLNLLHVIVRDRKFSGDRFPGTSFPLHERSSVRSRAAACNDVAFARCGDAVFVFGKT